MTHSHGTSEQIFTDSSAIEPTPGQSGSEMQPSISHSQPVSHGRSISNRQSGLPPSSSIRHMALSTLVSLGMVLALLAAARWMVPSLVEDVRYSWYRGQLRAEYELSSEQLQNVSLDSLADVSQMVAHRLGASVVHINLLREQQVISQYERFLGRSNPNVRYEGQGSGFIIDSEGLILTNHHVIADHQSEFAELEKRIEVTLADGRQLMASVIGSDPKTDLAILKINASSLIPVEWGDSDEVVIGTPVWAVGSPYGLQQTVTFGIISGKHRINLSGTRYQDHLRSDPAYADLMQSDVAVNPGNSGGPLVNAQGKVVGVNAAILGESFRGISFSIPSRVAKRVAQQLIERGEVLRGWMGIRMEDLAYDERYGVDGQIHPGVRVTGFPSEEPSPARQAGLEVGDLILEYENHLVMSQMELMQMIGETEVGSAVEVIVKRGPARLRFLITLGKRNSKI
jgi:serine protease Do